MNQIQTFRAETIMCNLPDGVLIYDAKGTLRSINPAAASLVGFSSTDEAFFYLSNHDEPLEFYDSDHNKLPPELYPSVLAIHGTRFTAMQLRVRNTISNIEIECSFSASVVNNDIGEIDYVIVTCTRVSAFAYCMEAQKVPANGEMVKLQGELEKNLDMAARLKQELATLNEEVNSFSHTISHDLRAPLQVIISYSEVLLDEFKGALGEEGTVLLQQIIASVYKMNSLISDMLRLSRISRQEMNVEETDVSAVVKETLEELRRASPGRNVIFVVEENVLIRADKGLMRAIIQSLLSNAWKYTSKRATARIEFGCLRQNGDRILFVRDNGEGFDQRHSTQIFAPFSRLHSRKEYEGNGIGLAIARRAVNRHRGRIWAQGDVGVGATFYLVLWQ